MPSFYTQAPMNFRVLSCWRCGVTFAIEAGYEENREKDGRSFHCPNGHKQVLSKPENKEETRERQRTKVLELHLREQEEARRSSMEAK